MREFLIVLHRWLGLSAGLFFVMQGLTGSLITFSPELDAWLNPGVLTAPTPGGAVITADAAAAAARAHMGRAPDFINLPGDYVEVYSAWYSGKPKDRFSFGESTQVLIDPASGRVLGQRVWGAPVFDRLNLMPMLFKFHYTLQAGWFGALAVSILGSLVFASLVSGVVLWWPRSRAPRDKWKGAFSLRRNAALFRQLFDWHRLLGIYSIAVLGGIVFTGLYMAWKITLPEAAKAPVKWVSTLGELPGVKSRRQGKEPALGLDAALASAQQAFAGSRATRVRLPKGTDGVIDVTLRQEGEWRKSSGYTRVLVDQYSGARLHVRDPYAVSGGDRFIDALFPLHSGEAFGALSRVLVCIAGLVPAALFATGAWMWLRRRRQSPVAQVAPSRIGSVA
jgi:uncharacterized iron-regulated membrane protein